MNAKVNIINTRIKELNKYDVPAIFIITGNNSTGKTTFTKKLIQKIDFYQSVNLGIISKMIRFFDPAITPSELENFNGNKASLVFKKLVDFMVEFYSNTGVNIIIEGVQIDTRQLLKNKKVLGGVILKVTPGLACQRGNDPETHFKRSLKEHQLKKVHYMENERFKLIDNNGDIEKTFGEILLHLDTLLCLKLKEYE